MAGLCDKSIRTSSDFEKYYCIRESEVVRKIKETIAREKKLAEEAARPEKIRKIMRFPLVKLTQEEFDNLRKAGDFTVDWLRNEAPYDFKFICKPSDLVPGVVVMGHLVEGNKAISEQYGAGLCAPKKFINRYRVEIVEPAEKVA